MAFLRGLVPVLWHENNLVRGDFTTGEMEKRFRSLFILKHLNGDGPMSRGLCLHYGGAN